MAKRNGLKKVYIHAFLDGVSFYVADVLNINIGNTFSGGVIDYTLFGVLQGQDRTHWLYVLVVGAIWFVLYYLLFRFLITRFKVATPGHLEDTMAKDAVEPGTELKVEGSGNALEDEAAQVVTALGGPGNLEEVDACITRLRVSVKDPALVDKPALRRLGAADVFEVSGGVQAVFGAKAILYKNVINESLGIDD